MAKHEPGKKQRQFRKRLRTYRSRRRGRLRRPIPAVAVPSFFTLMNLFSGFLSITQTMAGNYEQACWLVVLAAFFDVLDGLMARITNSASLFGVELDSLADIVSFGLAPSVLVYAYGLSDAGMLGVIASALPAICGAVRLARFNVTFDGEKKEHFSGLPIPTAAAFIIALILNVEDTQVFHQFSVNNLSLLFPIVIVLGGLMVSNVPFDAMPNPTPRYIRQHRLKFGLYLTGLILTIVFQQIGLLIALTGYLIQGIGMAFVHFVRAVNAVEDEDSDKPDAESV